MKPEQKCYQNPHFSTQQMTSTTENTFGWVNDDIIPLLNLPSRQTLYCRPVVYFICRLDTINYITCTVITLIWKSKRKSSLHDSVYRKVKPAVGFLDSEALPRLHVFSYEERRNFASAFVSGCSNTHTRDGQHDKLTHHAVYRTSVAGCNPPANNSRGCYFHLLQQRLVDGKGRGVNAFLCTLPQNFCKVALNASLYACCNIEMQ